MKLDINGHETYLECAYQGSKVFRDGGPFTDLFLVSPREAKKDSRLQSSGQLVGFELMERKFPLSPKNAFYDWLYIRALLPHRLWICKNVSYDGYTDIEFNPGRSVNCQARAFAEMIALAGRGQLEDVADDFAHFANLLPPA